MHTGNEPLRLAIIGGGVAGLSTAYYLQHNARAGDRPLHIDIYERKATLGGNADTVVVDLGNYIDATNVPHAHLRWADLGVNDVNLTTCVKLREIMTQIGYLENMLPLQDTTSYFNRSGSLALTDDAGLRAGVTDPAFSLAHANAGKLLPLINTVHAAAVDMLSKITPAYTVGQFFSACVAQPAQMLAKSAAKLGIAIEWDDPQLQTLLAKVRDDIYYPRIAAMYFADERNGPAMLPLQSPFEYFNLQQGKPGGPPAQRCYFDKGAQKWLEALADYVQLRSNELVKITVHTETDVKVKVRCGRVAILGQAVTSEHDLCVLATHADDTLKLLSFDADMGDWNRQVRATLSRVTYTRGFAVCHTFAGQMPQNKNIWRTYNVRQREPADASAPYRISYVENLHQNDPVNPQYAGQGVPMYLISLVKSLDEIPVETMLDRVREPHRADPSLLASLPRATQRQLQGESLATGYRTPDDATHDVLRNKAWTAFKHNVLNAECIGAQDHIRLYNQGTGAQIKVGHQPSCALLIGGGWTRGAGLQEQCIEQAALIEGWIRPALRAELRAVAMAARADAPQRRDTGQTSCAGGSLLHFSVPAMRFHSR